MTVVRYLPIRGRRCVSCQILFTPRHRSHCLCLQCWSWNRAGHAIAATRRALKTFERKDGHVD
jgi:hypothetical protein